MPDTWALSERLEVWLYHYKELYRSVDVYKRQVYMRLSSFYGEAFSMNIENQAAGGLKIDIFLPALPGKE